MLLSDSVRADSNGTVKPVMDLSIWKSHLLDLPHSAVGNKPTTISTPTLKQAQPSCHARWCVPSGDRIFLFTAPR
jgi:hypothetical protein